MKLRYLSRSCLVKKWILTNPSLRESLKRIYWIVLQFLNFPHNISQNTIRSHLKSKDLRISGQIVWVFLEWIVSMMFLHTIWSSFHLWREQSSIHQTSGCFSGIVSVMRDRATYYYWRRYLQLLSTSIKSWHVKFFERFAWHRRTGHVTRHEWVYKLFPKLLYPIQHRNPNYRSQNRLDLAT